MLRNISTEQYCPAIMAGTLRMDRMDACCKRLMGNSMCSTCCRVTSMGFRYVLVHENALKPTLWSFFAAKTELGNVGNRR